LDDKYSEKHWTEKLQTFTETMKYNTMLEPII